MDDKLKVQKSGNTKAVLEFDTPVLLIGGGEIDPQILAEFAARDFVPVAADGAANNLKEHHIHPAAIIGDMDSLKDRAFWEERTKVLEFAEQDTTDFEKCLYATKAPLYLALGFTGHQFDHTLAALHVLSKYAGEKAVLMVDTVDVIFATVGDFRMKMTPGARVSIYPFARAAFKRSTGLKFPLDGLVLEQGNLIGTSNEVSGYEVFIEPVANNESPYAVVMSHSYLNDLIETLA
ncbi:MAG: thiamine diphosphokinase [Hyphomicrobiales bacterium]